MNSPYKVSIGIPVYGVEKYIERCARSLFEQTYEDVEFVFVNDCTYDNSIQILESVIKEYHDILHQVKLINHDKNQGIAYTRNEIINMHTGRYLLFVDGDDWLEVDAVDKLVKFQRQTDADIISFGSVWHYHKRNCNKIYPFYKSPKEMLIHSLAGDMGNAIWGRFINSNLFRENQNIRCENGINIGEDFQLLILLIHYSKKVSTLNDMLYHYECRNNHSCTYFLSEEKMRDIQKSYKITYKKISIHDDSFELAYKIRLIKSYASHMVNACKNKDNKEYYMYIYKKVHEMSQTEWIYVPFLKRILFLIGNYHIAKLYINIMLRLKNIKIFLNKYGTN